MKSKTEESKMNYAPDESLVEWLVLQKELLRIEKALNFKENLTKKNFLKFFLNLNSAPLQKECWAKKMLLLPCRFQIRIFKKK